MRKYIIGIGLVLIIVYNPNQPLISLLFLPWIGLALLVSAVISIPFKELKKAGLGSKWVWIPLLVLCFSIAASGVAQYLRGEVSLTRGLAPTFSTVIWFGLYLVARIDGDGIGKPLAIAVIIESVSTVVMAYASNGVKNGGIISPTNYDISAFLLVLGTFLAPRKWQWWLSAIAVVGLFFTGAEYGIVAIGTVLLVIIAVRDWSIKTLLPVSALIVCLLVATPTGITHNLYISNPNGQGTASYKIGGLISAITNWSSDERFNQEINIATGYRWNGYWKIDPILPFGYGYNLTEYYVGIPHNIALVIIQQVGLLGLAGWLVAAGYCIKTSKRYYLWAAILALGMFDHSFFTEWAALFWVCVGLSEAHPYKSPNIFKEVESDVQEVRQTSGGVGVRPRYLRGLFGRPDSQEYRVISRKGGV